MQPIFDLSVIICTYNRCQSLRDTLESLSAQKTDGKISFEVIVADNNSQDDTKSIVEKAAGNFKRPIRYLFEARQGKSYALNHGIREAKGEFLVFTDDDVIPDPNWVQKIYNAFIEDNADGAGGKILPHWLESPPLWAKGELLKKEVFRVFSFLDHGNEKITFDKVNPYVLIGANYAFRKRLFDEIGLFREDLGPYKKELLRGEDNDMIERALKAGKRIVYDPRAVVYHKVEPKRMRLSYFRKWKYWTGFSGARMFARTKRGIPLWLFRECTENGLKSLLSYALLRIELGIKNELEFWASFGRIIGELTLRPKERLA